MEMKTRVPFLALILAVIAVVVAGCGGGGGGGSVPADSIAKVGSTPITKADLTAILNYAFDREKAQKQPVPKVGTQAYTQLRDQAVTYLVQEEELQQEADKLGVSVSQKDVDKRLATIKATYYHGSEKKFDAELKKDGVSLAQLEAYNLKPQLLASKLEDKVTSNIKVSDSAAQKYYDQNKTTYTTPETREVRHILVNTKALADKIEAKLKANPSSFPQLAKKYSKDTGSAQQGGKICVAHGQSSGACITTVTPFDKAAFALKTMEISQPVKSQYGWHIIQPLAAAKPAHTQTFKEVEASIKANLEQQQKQSAWTAWLAKVKKDYDSKVSYQTGYAPATTTTPTIPTTTG
jgi:foldase protein PrsA